MSELLEAFALLVFIIAGAVVCVAAAFLILKLFSLGC